MKIPVIKKLWPLKREAQAAMREAEPEPPLDQSEVLEQFDTETVRAFQQMIDADRD